MSSKLQIKNPNLNIWSIKRQSIVYEKQVVKVQFPYVHCPDWNLQNDDAGWLRQRCTILACKVRFVASSEDKSCKSCYTSLSDSL